MKTYWGSGGIAPRTIPALDGGEWSASRPGRLTPTENHCYPLNRRLGGPQSRSGRGGEGKKHQPLPGLEPPIIQPVAQRYRTALHIHSTVSYQVTRFFNFLTAGQRQPTQLKFVRFRNEHLCGIWRYPILKPHSSYSSLHLRHCCRPVPACGVNHVVTK
jgi:hypothetical protein